MRSESTHHPVRSFAYPWQRIELHSSLSFSFARFPSLFIVLIHFYFSARRMLGDCLQNTSLILFIFFASLDRVSNSTPAPRFCFIFVTHYSLFLLFHCVRWQRFPRLHSPSYILCIPRQSIEFHSLAWFPHPRPHSNPNVLPCSACLLSRTFQSHPYS